MKRCVEVFLTVRHVVEAVWHEIIGARNLGSVKCKSQDTIHEQTQVGILRKHDIA